MSEKSFAFLSISAAIVCGVFLYPPPPSELAAPALTAVAAPPAGIAPAHRDHPLDKALGAGTAPGAADRLLTATPATRSLEHGIAAAAN